MVAVASLAVGVIALRKDQTDAARIRTLQTQVRAAAAPASNTSSGLQEAQSKLSATDSELLSINEQLSKLAPKLTGVADCLPEVQKELGGLELKETRGTALERGSVYITNPVQVSIPCNKVLYPPAEQGG